MISYNRILKLFMNKTPEPNDLYFLSNNGEMSELIRNYDWSKSYLGTPDQWSLSLRTTIGIVLNSAFPMFLFWGEDNLCFYNDAYRPSLGVDGKHPAIGKKGIDVWPEIWGFINPLITQVMTTGKAVWYEDQLVPFYRNGKMEDIFWTFSYSAVSDDNGKINGVFVTCIETTGKVKVIKELEASKEEFRTMADNIPNLAWMADAEGYIYWYNRKWYDYTGTNFEQMKGWSWQSVHDPEKLPEVMLNWTSSITKGEPFEMIFPLKGADGKFRQFLTRVLHVRDHEGKIYQWFGTNTDITDRIEAEQQIKESEARFRTMAENADILIAMSDETSNAIYFNKSWANLTGRSVNDLFNFGWADLIHEEDRQVFLDIYLEAFEKKEPWTGEFRMLNKDKEYVWLLVKGAVRTRADGSFAGYISSSVDITDQKNALRNLKESEERLHDMILQSPIGVCLIDAPSLVSEIVNVSFIEVAGKPYDAIAGHYYWDTFAEAKPYYEAALKQVVEEGITYHANEVELMLVRHGKEENIFVTFIYAPLKDADGKVKKVAVWVLENTQQVNARQKIAEAEEKARLAINSAKLGVYETFWDRNETITDQRFKEIWGVDESATWKQYVDAIHPADLPVREQAQKEAFISGQLDYQIRVLWKDQSVHWVKITGEILFDDQQNPIKLVGMVQDITSAITAQQKLQKSEENLRNTILQAPVAMCIFKGPNYVVELANDRMFELFGRPSEDIMNKPIFEGLPEARDQGFEALMDGVYTTGKAFSAHGVPIKLPRSGNIEIVYVDFLYEAYRSADGSISGVLGVAIDVTPQIIAQKYI
jgi:PAS domain S-box-containing protein